MLMGNWRMDMCVAETTVVRFKRTREFAFVMRYNFAYEEAIRPMGSPSLLKTAFVTWKGQIGSCSKLEKHFSLTGWPAGSENICALPGVERWQTSGVQQSLKEMPEAVCRHVNLPMKSEVRSSEPRLSFNVP
jgi:hypothetical protein